MEMFGESKGSYVAAGKGILIVCALSDQGKEGIAVCREYLR